MIIKKCGRSTKEQQLLPVQYAPPDIELHPKVKQELLVAFAGLIIFLTIVVVAVLSHEKFRTLPIVALPKGKIAGHILRSGTNKNFYAFQEIPYAAPPTGTYRFKEPRDPNPWEHVLDTTRNTKVCMQLSTSYPNLTITEDCLYLNVYTPMGESSYPLPVLFYIHGGQFKLGSGILEEYNPKFLMDYGIVVVTINYRLGALGFLSTSDNTIPGNLAIKDQLKAVQWVDQNIHLFGGDKEKITVMGSSSGSMSAGHIHLSEQAKGLIKGLILTSGSVLSPCAYQDKNDYFAFKLGKALDAKFNSSNTKDLLELLHKSSAQEIVSAKVIDDIYNNIIIENLIWLPTIENKNNKNALVTKPMEEAISEGDFARIPMMFGIDSEEILPFLKDLDKLHQDAKKIDSNLGLLINPRLHILPEKLNLAGEEYRSVYTPLKFQDDIGAFVKYSSDDLFSTPTIHNAALASAYVPVYFFQFSYKGLMGNQHTLNISGVEGVGHAAELNYIFSSNEEPLEGKQFPKEDEVTQKRLLTLTTNFIKHQNPTPAADRLLQGIVWPQMKEKSLRYLNINTTLEIRENPRSYLQVRSVFEKYRRKPYFRFSIYVFHEHSTLILDKSTCHCIMQTAREL